MAHIRFVFELYDLQVQGGRYFLHEHPASATSWRLPEVVAFCLRYPHLYAVTGAMCQWGMTSRDPAGEVNPVRKLTRWLTNSPCLAETLEKPCSQDHSHTLLLSGRAAAAQVYPPQLCKAIVEAFSRQLQLDSRLCMEEFPSLSSLAPEPEDRSGTARVSGDPVVSEASSPSTVPIPTFNLEILQLDPEDPSDSQLEAHDDVHGGACLLG